MELVSQIFSICIIPLLGVLTKYLVDWLSAKREEVKSKITSDTAAKYLDMLTNTVQKCVIAVNQTYVETLKKSGEFDEAAQKEAFNKTLNAVLALLTDEAKEYITSITGDLELYLTQLIEAQVHLTKKQ